jgi:arylformamidase
MSNFASCPMLLTRRFMLGSAAAMITCPAVAQECRLGPPEHHKGPNVFLDYDQLELDASYDQSYYEPLDFQTYARLASNSQAARARLGVPRQVSYGPTEIEKLDSLPHRPRNGSNFRLYSRR